MATEIELKAHITNPHDIMLKLSRLTAFTGAFNKYDIFYTSLENPGISPYGVRVRKQTTVAPNGKQEKTNFVTYKSKVIQDGIEVNDEKEFEVSSSDIFEEFLSRLGFTESIRKHKEGDSFDYDGMTVELTNVESLGWFLELEVLLPERDTKKIDHEKEKLLRFIDRLEIPRESIESRSYTVMLTELSANNPRPE